MKVKLPLLDAEGRLLIIEAQGAVDTLDAFEIYLWGLGYRDGSAELERLQQEAR